MICADSELKAQLLAEKRSQWVKLMQMYLNATQTHTHCAANWYSHTLTDFGHVPDITCEAPQNRRAVLVQSDSTNFLSKWWNVLFITLIRLFSSNHFTDCFRKKSILIWSPLQILCNPIKWSIYLVRLKDENSAQLLCIRFMCVHIK